MAYSRTPVISHNGQLSCGTMSCSIRLLTRRGSLFRDVLPFDTNRALLTYMGRNAIWQALRILGLNPSDEVLVPAYNCGSEIDTLFITVLRLFLTKYHGPHGSTMENIRHRVTK